VAWAFALFAVFTVATGIAWARGLHISCGCFDLGIFGIPAWRQFFEWCIRLRQ